MLSSFQNKKFSYLFNILDVNKDGYLELSDFSDFSENIRAMIGLEPESDEHKRIAKNAVKFYYKLVEDVKPKEFQHVSNEEWCLFFYKIYRLNNDDVLDEYCDMMFKFMLDFFDSDRDGYISKSEYVDLHVIFGIDRSLLDESFTALDISGDERISRYELRGALEEFLLSDNPKDPGNWVFGYWGSELIEV